MLTYQQQQKQKYLQKNLKIDFLTWELLNKI